MGNLCSFRYANMRVVIYEINLQFYDLKRNIHKLLFEQLSSEMAIVSNLE